MGKGTDKLYITHSEWASENAYSASAGSGIAKGDGSGASFKRLPFNFCAVSLQPFSHPVCTADGTIFDITHILPWLKKHGTNPVTGEPLKSSELIKLHFAKNDEGEMSDPVTFKVFTDNTHIVALSNTGNVFAWDTVERLNIKAKMWRDLVSDEEFSRKDIITLQDPQNIESRNLSSFKYLQEGVSSLTEEQKKERSDPARNVNKAALGNAAGVLKVEETKSPPSNLTADSNKTRTLSKAKPLPSTVAKPSKVAFPSSSSKPLPYNAAQHTTGKAAASFTSTGLTPHTSNERALLTDEEYLLKPRRVKHKGYVRIQTSLGELNLELLPEFAPRAVWNFVHLAKKGYYNDLTFHRSIRNFMLQGGDPTGTGKGGSSIWGKNFKDEFDGPLGHDARGVVSMANKGKDTNGSQFFITYRAAKHLDRKHTIFGRVVGGMNTLSRIENVEVGEGDRPVTDVVIQEVVVFVDPFEEARKERREQDEKEVKREE
ncbi:RING-type E3 ubiquitin-protein ligase ppil2, partial [Sticta canariensis]|nr:RING-type E3 ubiquitin-protein ligase ppil2 [Sticta canariensis]